jgi:hypothetical protein
MLTLLGDLLMAFLETYIRTRIVGNHNPFLWLLLLNETANKLGDLFQKEKKKTAETTRVRVATAPGHVTSSVRMEEDSSKGEEYYALWATFSLI